MNEDTALAECRGLYRFYGKQAAVSDVSFTLHRGEVLGFLGPNGAGKSSTMNMLAGVLAPNAGRIRIDGQDLFEAPLAAKARIGYLPESPPLYPELTVDEYLNYCARLRGIPRRGCAARVERARERCGLSREGRRMIGNLSRGYRQRVGIAQAIVHEPALIILDEPTVGLDPIQIREIRALIAELGQDHGVILSTHILPEVQATCSRVQIMHRGRLVYRDSMAALSTAEGPRRTRVRFRHAPDPQALWKLPGVEGVERISEYEFRLEHGPEADELAVATARFAVKEGIDLELLQPEERGLEQLFVELTSADTENDPLEAAS